MEKIKWKYELRPGWYIGSNNEVIRLTNKNELKRSPGKRFTLCVDHVSNEMRFRKLSSAKAVANSLRNG